MGLFSGLKGAKTVQAKSDWFVGDGSYVVSLQKFVARESTKPGPNKGQPLVIVEADIVEVLTPEDASGNRKGQRVAWFNMLQRNPIIEGSQLIGYELTDRGAKNAGRVKQFLAAAMQVDVELIDEDMAEGAAEGDGEAFKGLLLRADVRTTHYQKDGQDKSFTEVTWSPLDD